MRHFMLLVCLGGASFGQAIVEYSIGAAAGSLGAAGTGRAAGSSIGSVFQGLNNTLGQSSGNTQTARPAAPQVRRGNARQRAASGGARGARPQTDVVHVAVPTPVPPPPPVSAEDLKKITAGMRRNDVLQFGTPSARVSMAKEGHLVEIFSYMAKGETLGVVQLTDGSVSSVKLP
jgi:hypothetical protein